ncbi:MAG: hypothetical protein CL946_05550 [Ectothiorhodospiraceae bacterium]|nr:hypothetical protein [Ectothiorhodospiraceae bacterium]
MKLSYIAAALALMLICIGCSTEDSGTLTFTGIMDTDEVRVSSQSQGILRTLLAQEGAQVVKDSQLAVIESDKLGYQLSTQKETISELDHAYEAAKQQLEAAMAEHDNARRRYERFRALLDKDAVTRQQADDVLTKFRAARANRDAAQANLASVKSKQAQVRSTMKITEEQIQDASVVAPLSGTVLVTYAEAGEFVGPGTPLLDIADLSTLWTKIYIAEEDLPRIKLGQNAEVHIDGTEETLQGTITWISSESEFTPKTILTEETRTSLVYAAKVTVDNSSGILKIGMPVVIQIEEAAQ